MSYILDALKKVENEKAKKNRTSGMVSISGELFCDEQRIGSRGGKWKTLFVMIAVSLLTFAGTWYFIKPGNHQDGTGTKIPVVVPTKTLQQTVPQKTDQTAAPQKAMAAANLAQDFLQPAAPPVTLKTDPPPLASPVVKQARHLKGQIISGKTVVKEQVAIQTIAAPADIQVSGIAWQDERSARRCVVNGFLMHEGSVVAGARITEILPDRVRFYQAGKSFEVTLLAAGLSGPTK